VVGEGEATAPSGERGRASAKGLEKGDDEDRQAEMW
jgi:hypothetical protein